jgi:GNAT superfamily N-acetyltransferase
MKIIKVDTQKHLRQFIRFPWKIYSKIGPWVPPLISDTVKILSENKNPFWMHAKKQLFLAFDNDINVVGRIAAIIDYNYISFQNDRCGFFGFFECVDDVKVAESLFLAAENWLKEQNIHKMIGPMNPSTNNECGFLLYGFDISPSLMMPYTPKYYLRLAEQSNLKKIKELYAYDMDVKEDSRMSRLGKVVALAKKKLPMLKVRNVCKSSYQKDLKVVMSVYNRAWARNWGFVPWGDEEFVVIASKLKMFIDFKMIIIATVDDIPVGTLISIPDYNQVLKKLDGKLSPLGIFKFLYYRRKIDSLRLMIMGVTKEYRQKGIEAVMYEESLRNALRLGYKHCELSWVLDDNIMTQRTAEMMNGKIYKKYAIYSS